MNFKKLLTLSAAALMVGTTAVGCNNADKETLSAAAEYLWQMYRNTDETEVTGSFDVVNKVSVGDQIVSVTWAIEATGSKEAFGIEAKNDNFSTVKVGYYDGLVKENSTVKLVPTFTLGKTSLTLADVYADEASKHAIDFTTPVLTLNNHADWDKNDGALLNIRGVVVDVIATGSSAGSIYMVDAEGNGYYVYNPSSKGAKVGDEIVATGTRSDYSGQEEFAKGGTYGIVKKGQQDTIKFVDASADWAAASSNKSTGDLGAKYQNTPVKLEKCTPTRISGSYYYFKVGNGTTEYNVYKNTYFLTDDQTAAWVAMFEDALAKGYTLTIEGISTVYSSAYQIYPCSLKANVFTKEAELTADEKHAIVKDVLEAAVKESYDSEATYEPALPAYAQVTYEVTAPTANASVAVKEGKLAISPINADVENTVVAHVKIGDVTKDVTLKFVTEDASVAKFKTGEIAIGAVEADKEVKIKATYAKGGEAEVTVLAKGVEDSKGDWKIGAGDSILITAPEGFQIGKVEVDSNGNYNTLDYYADAEKTTKFDDNTLTDSNDPYSNQYRTENNGRTLTTIPVNGKTFLISNDSAEGFNVYSKWIKVTLVCPVDDLDKTKVDLTAATLLGWEGKTVAYNTEEASKTVNGVEFKYLQIGCYGDGIQMRKKEVSEGVIQSSTFYNTTAIEGIKGVKLNHNPGKKVATKTDIFSVYFSNNADFSDAVEVKVSTVEGTNTYNVAPASGTYKYVKFVYDAKQSGSFYWNSIVIDY